MSVLLSNYSNLTSGLKLSNSIDVIANSYSLIDGNGVVNIRDLIGTGGGGTIDAYTKVEMDNALLLKQNTLNWLTGNSNGKNTISTGDGLFLITMPAANGSYTPAVLINGSGITGKEGQTTFYKKVIMNNALEVSGAITAGGLSVLTTDTGYTKTNVDDLLKLQEPRFTTPGAIIKSLDVLTGAYDLILSSEFTDMVNGKASTASLTAYQPKLISNSSEGRNLLMDDGKTVFAIDEGQNIKITPTFSILSGAASNFRLQIKVTDAFTTQVNTNTTDIETLQTTKLNTTSTTSWDNLTGQLNLNGSTGNYIAWNTNGVGPPTFTTRSVGTKLVLYPSIRSTTVDYAIGVDTATLWYAASVSTAGHRWYCATTQAMNLTTSGLVVAGPIYRYQGNSTSITATATLTIAQLLTGVISVVSASFVSLTLPTGTLTHGGMIGGSSSTLPINQGFEWSIINMGNTSGSITLSTNASANTLVGSGIVPLNTSARFLTRLSAANTAYTYRLS
jgi:hypothetical protein